MEKSFYTRRLTGLALFTAIVVVLQLMGSFIHFGVFSISLVLVPIVVGAALYGAMSGAWLGFVFGVTVLLSGDASAFLAVTVPGTIVTVLVKGALAGLCAGLVYRAVAGRGSDKAHADGKRGISRSDLAVVLAGIVCPIVNTGVFLICCRLFFYDTVAEWGAALGFKNVVTYMFVGLVGGNFLFELLFNIILSPIIIRIINLGQRYMKRRV